MMIYLYNVAILIRPVFNEESKYFCRFVLEENLRKVLKEEKSKEQLSLCINNKQYFRIKSASKKYYEKTERIREYAQSVYNLSDIKEKSKVYYDKKKHRLQKYA